MSGPSFVLNKTGLSHSYLAQSAGAKEQPPSVDVCHSPHPSLVSPCQRVSCLLALLCFIERVKGLCWKWETENKQCAGNSPEAWPAPLCSSPAWSQSASELGHPAGV